MKLISYFQLEIQWSDGHFSQYTSNWLRERAFRDDVMQSRSLMATGPKKILWGKEHIDDIRYHNYASIINQPRVMYDWINGNYIEV